MCVKIIKDNAEFEYDCNISFMDQIAGSSEVIVNYKPNDHEIEVFLSEIQKCVKNGTNPQLNIKVKYNDFLNGFKMKKHLKQAMNDISLNEIVKLMVLSQVQTDKKLEELSFICLNRDLNVE